MFNVVGEGIRFFDREGIVYDNCFFGYEWHEVSGSDIGRGVFPRVLQVDTQKGLRELQRWAADSWKRNAFLNVEDVGMYIYDCFVHGYMNEHYYRNAASRYEIWRDQLREQLGR